MSKTVGKINVAIEADSKGLKAGLNKAEAQVTRSAKKMSSSMEKNMKFGAGMAKAFAALGAIEGGLKGAMAVTKLWKGDLDGANEAFAAMPMGIGAVASAVQDLAMEWSGANEAQEKFNKSQAQHLKNVNAQRGGNALLAQLQAKVDLGGTKDAGRRKVKQAALEHKAVARKISDLEQSGKLRRGQADELYKANDALLNQVGRQVEQADRERRRASFANLEKEKNDKKLAGIAKAKLASEQQARSNASAQARGTGMLGQLKNTSELIGQTGKERELTQAMQTLNATMKQIDEMASGDGKLKPGQRQELETAAREIYKKTLGEINKIKPVAEKKISSLASGFEEVGLSRSRLSGRGGPLDIVTEKPPTMRGQATANSLLMKIAENTRGANAAVAG
jgi:hypothetical protein